MRRSRTSSWLNRLRRVLDGQTFDCIAVERVRFHRGFTPVLRWRSTCASCGDPYEFRTCRKPPDTYLERQCRRHAAKPGRVVRPHLHLGSGTPGLLDRVLYEDRDGRVFTFAGVPFGKAKRQDRLAPDSARSDAL